MAQQTLTACPACQARLAIEPQEIGRQVECPKCHSIFTAGKPSPPAPAEAIKSDQSTFVAAARQRVEQAPTAEMGRESTARTPKATARELLWFFMIFFVGFNWINFSDRSPNSFQHAILGVALAFCVDRLIGARPSEPAKR